MPSVRERIFTRTAVACLDFARPKTVNGDNMTWKNKKVLITGADGFIGSHLAERLVALGADVTALALYNSFDAAGWLDDAADDTRRALRIVRGDVRDPHQMAALCKGQDIVFHLAALIAIPYSYDAPSSYVQTNVQGTVNVLKGALSAEVSRVVHTSTSEVYGTAQFTPINEVHPVQGQSPYSASKIGADMVAESFARSFGLPVVTLRPFNTYGPRQSERAVISTVIRQVLDDRCDAIRIGDLTPTRDFNYVGDTVEAFLAVAGLDAAHVGRVFNAGSGRMVSIGEMLELVRAVTGCEKQVIHEELRKRPANSEVLTLLADANRLTEASGWSSQVTLEQGIDRTLAWWRSRIDRIRDDSGYMV
jgi:NAD dependent epimerase/dehydratase